MKKSIREELAQHLLDLINDEVLTDENKEDWHHHAFNEDYYIVGHYNAEQWLKKHDLSAFEAIGDCQDWEENVLGEKQNTYDNAETVVNMVVYVYGEGLLNDLDAASITELKEALEDEI